MTLNGTVLFHFMAMKMYLHYDKYNFLNNFIKTKKYHLLFFLLLLVFSLFYQNCSEQSAVLYKNSLEPSTFLKIPLKTSICSEISFLKDDNNKFLFVIDMSQSNIGTFIERTHLEYFWVEDFGKDIDGNRFNAVENFISICANSDNNKFAIIGFSTGAGEIKYNSTSSTRRSFLECGNSIEFKDKDEVIENLNTFREAQELEKEYFSSRWSNSFYTNDTNNYPSLALTFTSYSQATNCASKIINTDFIKSKDTQLSKYQVIFLSDGVPNDPTPQTNCNTTSNTEQSGCPTDQIKNCKTEEEGPVRDQCYIDTSVTPIKSTMLDLQAYTSELNLLAIGYGIEDEENFKFLNALSSIKRPIPAKEIDTFSDGNIDVLCQLVSTEIGYEVSSSSLMSVVLSLGQRGNTYLSDSDMDGIFDIDEPYLSYDPKNPRSGVNGVLDGICEKIGGLKKCIEAMSLLESDGGGCDPKLLVNSNGLSDCDIKMIKQQWGGLNLDDSSDWDKDGVPNFIEIVKATDPFSNDMNKDIDNDGMSTQFEIMRSKNPYESSGIFPPNPNEIIVQNTLKGPTNQCLNGSQELILKKVPPIESQDISLEDIIIHESLRHGKNEHIVAIFSSRTTQNYFLQNRGMIGKFVKLQSVKPYEDTLNESNENSNNGNSNNGNNNEDFWILSPSPGNSQLTNCNLNLWDPLPQTPSEDDTSLDCDSQETN